MCISIFVKSLNTQSCTAGRSSTTGLKDCQNIKTHYFLATVYCKLLHLLAKLLLSKVIKGRKKKTQAGIIIKNRKFAIT